MRVPLRLWQSSIGRCAEQVEGPTGDFEVASSKWTIRAARKAKPSPGRERVDGKTVDGTEGRGSAADGQSAFLPVQEAHAHLVDQAQVAQLEGGSELLAVEDLAIEGELEGA